MALIRKHQAFVDSLFLHNMNATAAYCDVYGVGREVGSANSARLLTNASISDEIKRRLDENTMSANEVISRLSDHARGNMEDFLDITSLGFTIDLEKARRLGKANLIKEIRQKVTTIVTKAGDDVETVQTEIKIHDPQAALVTLAKYHGLLVDRQDITTRTPVNMVEVILPEEPADDSQ